MKLSTSDTGAAVPTSNAPSPPAKHNHIPELPKCNNGHAVAPTSKFCPQCGVGVDAIIAHIGDTLGFDKEKWAPAPNGYPNSLALCVIDAVYSLNAQYTGVVNILNCYRTVRRNEGGNPEIDSLNDLAATLEKHGANCLFNNRQLGPGTKKLKADIIAEVTKRLLELRVSSVAEFRERYSVGNEKQIAELKNAWLGVKGLGETSWHYFALLTGEQDVKPDRMIVRFVAQALNDNTVSPSQARAAILDTAKALEIEPRVLDHAIWSYQRNSRNNISNKWQRCENCKKVED